MWVLILLWQSIHESLEEAMGNVMTPLVSRSPRPPSSASSSMRSPSPEPSSFRSQSPFQSQNGLQSLGVFDSRTSDISRSSSVSDANELLGDTLDTSSPALVVPRPRTPSRISPRNIRNRSSNWVESWFPKTPTKTKERSGNDSDDGSKKEGSKRKGMLGVLGLTLPSHTATAIIGTGYAKAKIRRKKEKDTDSVSVSTDARSSIDAPSIGPTSPSVPTPSVNSPVQNLFIPPAIAPPQLTTAAEPLAPSASFQSSAASTGSKDHQTPPHTQGAAVQAIVNATRIMSSDPSSILSDPSSTSELVKASAWELVTYARSIGLVYTKSTTQNSRTKPKPAPPPAPAEEPKEVAKDKPDWNPSAPSGELSLPSTSVSVRSHLNKTLNATRKGSLSLGYGNPLFSTLASQQQALFRRVSSVDVTIPTAASPQLGQEMNSGPSTVRSVAMESIVPVHFKPPTLSHASSIASPTWAHSSNALSRFVSSVDVPVLPHATALTDKYGFTYTPSKYDALLLVRAKDVKCTAPACLTGIRIADRCEDDVEPGPEDELRDMDIVNGDCDCDGSGFRKIIIPEDGGSLTSALSSAPTTFSQDSQPSSKGSSSILVIGGDSPTHACQKTIRKLLDELKDIHDSQQRQHKSAWVTFLKTRETALKKGSGKSNNPLTSFAASSGAAAMLGIKGADVEDELAHHQGLIGFAQMGLSSNRVDERKELDKLVRAGIPLQYRAKVWSECSGAMEMMEPGTFHDLAGKEGSVACEEIAKDISRTMPANIFFGGAGPGVEKLKRVLVAYSW